MSRWDITDLDLNNEEQPRVRPLQNGEVPAPARVPLQGW
jgi:hypothetical protein